MVKPRVIIVCISKKNSQILKKQLDNLFGDFITFEAIDYQENFNTLIGCDLVLASGNKVANLISKFLMQKTDILVIRRTIQKESLEKLSNIPISTRVLVVNDDQEMTEETISLIYELGVKKAELVPYYPGRIYNENIDVAITPNEVKLVPEGIKNVINIGPRVIDSSTIFDMLNKLDLLNKRTTELVLNHMNMTIPLSPGLTAVLNYNAQNKLNFELALNSLDYGIIVYDHDSRIIFCNKVILNILGFPFYEIAGKTLEEFEEHSGIKSIDKPRRISNKVYDLNGRLFLIDKLDFVPDNKYSEGVIILKEYEKIKRLESSFRFHTSGKGHVAKYSFQDIIGNSKSIKKAINQAQLFSEADSAILIQGESGTGKELMAQAIHKSSKRREGPFIAFNCAALSDTLLESELFGYEEGAFTGAKKAGKPGLFELANKGTLFLDEIGDITLNLQSKLLRVLQEKEIIRVGGIETIPIDIRIISATNKNLLSLVEENKFRLDLFYRLNILPLSIPPLKERKEDIQDLINYFFKAKRINKDISDKALGILIEYDWPGNVRELENCVEYISSFRKSRIEKEDLPEYIILRMTNRSNPQMEEGQPIKEKLHEEDKAERELAYILMVLKEASIKGKKLGRAGISRELKRYLVFLTEAEVRKHLKTLKDQGFIVTLIGRGGTQITDKGLDRIEGSQKY